MSNFNVNLKKIREKKGLTAKEVAIDLGIPYTTYLKYEGVGEPRYDTLIKIADYLNVSIDTLLGYTPNEYEYYKQWLLSTNQIEIDDSSDSIRIFFYYKSKWAIPFDIPKEKYSFIVGNKENLISTTKFIKKTVTETMETDINEKIIELLKFIIDMALSSADIENLLHDDKLSSEIVEQLGTAPFTLDIKKNASSKAIEEMEKYINTFYKKVPLPNE